MPEYKLLIDGLTVSYEGLFEIKELYKLLEDWFKENKYEKKETLNQEIVKEDKKQLFLVLEPFKSVSDYHEYRLQVRIAAGDLREVEVEKDGVKMRMQKGNVSVVINAFLVSDKEMRWAHRPLFFFMRVLIDKFIYKMYVDRFEAGLRNEITNLHTTIKSFLNLYRYK